MKERLTEAEWRAAVALFKAANEKYKNLSVAELAEEAYEKAHNHKYRTKKAQSKKTSLIESIISNAIGFMLTVIVQLLLFPDQPFSQNFKFSLVLLVVLVVRSYLLRRAFNYYEVRQSKARKAAKRLKRKLEEQLKQEENAIEVSGTVRRDGEESGLLDSTSTLGVQERTKTRP